MPGRNFNPGSHRYMFGGKEQDPEVKGTGNSYDFGERIYDPRLGRWLSLDPLQKKYAGLNPYNFTFNNPIIFKDPDGKDGRLSVDYDKKQVTLETTIFIYGGDKSVDYKQMAAKYNETYASMNNSKSVKAANGEEWTVTVNVKFVYDETLDKNMSAMGTSGSDLISTSTTEGIVSNSGYKPGDNTLKVNTTANLGSRTEGIAGQGYNEAQTASTDPRVGIHEVFHNLGYSDRYDTQTGLSLYPGGGLMLGGGGAGGGTTIGDYQFVDLLDFALQQTQGKSGTTVMGEFTQNVPSKTIPGQGGAPDTEIVGGTKRSTNLAIDGVDNRSTKQRDTDVGKSSRVKDVQKK